jgi:hypothetical protein
MQSRPRHRSHGGWRLARRAVLQIGTAQDEQPGATRQPRRTWDRWLRGPVHDVSQLDGFPGDRVGPGHRVGQDEPSIHRYPFAGPLILADQRLYGAHTGLLGHPLRGQPGSAAGQSSSPPAGRSSVSHLEGSVITFGDANDADEPRFFGDGHHEGEGGATATAAVPAIQPVLEQLLASGRGPVWRADRRRGHRHRPGRRPPGDPHPLAHLPRPPVTRLRPDLAKAERQLTGLQARLARGRTRRPRTRVEAEISQITAARWVTRVLQVTLTGSSPASLRLSWHADDQARQALEAEYFGKRILFTDRDDWPAAEVIAAYRSQADAEAGFRQLKDPASSPSARCSTGPSRKSACTPSTASWP